MIFGLNHGDGKLFNTIRKPGNSDRCFQANTGGDKAVRENKGGVIAAVEKKKKESIVDLSKYLDKAVRVKFQGGREAQGVLKGYDPLLNLVLDNTTEFLRG